MQNRLKQGAAQKLGKLTGGVHKSSRVEEVRLLAKKSEGWDKRAVREEPPRFHQILGERRGRGQDAKILRPRN